MNVVGLLQESITQQTIECVNTTRAAQLHIRPVAF